MWIWIADKFTARDLDLLKLTGCKRVYIKAYDDASSPRRWPEINKELLSFYKSFGFECWAWGYHGNAPMDELQAASDVKALIEMGFEGYIFDVEAELKDKTRHRAMDEVLKACRPVVQAGKMGFSSFGFKQSHPDFPWEIFDAHCDIHFPQIYFEQWKSAPDETVASIVNEALFSFHGMKTKICPVFSSEPGARYPSSAKDLQEMINKYEGSSVWRLTSQNEPETSVWKVKYS